MVWWLELAPAVEGYADWNECELRKRLIEVTEKRFGAHNPRLVRPLSDYASWCGAENRDPGLDRATVEALFARALAIARATWGALHPDVFYVLRKQGEYYASREPSSAAAEAMNARGERMLAQLDAQEASYYSPRSAVLSVERIYDVMGVDNFDCSPFDSPRCAQPLREALTTLTEHWGADHPALAEWRAHLAYVLGVSHRSNSGSKSANAALVRFVDEQFQLAMSSTNARYGRRHPQSARIAGTFAEYLATVGQHERATKLQMEVIEIYEQQFGRDDTATDNARESLGIIRAYEALSKKCPSSRAGC
jgi:hypothetical protein